MAIPYAYRLPPMHQTGHYERGGSPSYYPGGGPPGTLPVTQVVTLPVMAHMEVNGSWITQVLLEEDPPVGCSPTGGNPHSDGGLPVNGGPLGNAGDLYNDDVHLKIEIPLMMVVTEVLLKETNLDPMAYGTLKASRTTVAQRTSRNKNTSWTIETKQIKCKCIRHI